MANFRCIAFNFLTTRQFFHVFVANLIFFIIGPSCVYGVTLDTDGYYDIVIAINEKTAQNSNEKYLENLKAGIQDLSDALFESTHEKFSIRSADIILPNHWNIEADGFVTTQNYHNSDFRISHEYLVPQTINPTFCGHPGRYIELPYTFFDTKDVGPYGPTGKALLTLWARYRWGIFEEHGYPGDSRFPYYWKAWAPWNPTEPVVPPEPWKVTSCNNVALKGKYETISNETCGPDYVPPDVTENPEITTVEPYDPTDDRYPPPSDCRFKPDIFNQSASTSLMSFNFVQSLTDFCDSATHDQRAPNRQNLFCQFKSAWEVIEQSFDWKQLKEDSVNRRTPINFRILKKSEKPLLFILTEGVNTLPDEVISAMVSNLTDIFEKTEHWNVITSAGVFPGLENRNSFDTIYKWNTPWHNIQELITAFQDSVGSRDDSKFRNFGAALQDIGNLIKDREHSAGAVVVVLKYGSETYELREHSQAYESEVIATILSQNIRIFALEGDDELADGDFTSPYRLKNLAELSGGLHFRIGYGEEDIANVVTVMNEVDSILKIGSVPAGRYRLAYKDAQLYRAGDDGNVMIPVLVNYREVTKVLFYIHGQSSMVGDASIVKGPDVVTNLPTFSENNQWAKFEFTYRSFLANWTTTDDPLTEPSEWTCALMCYSSECLAMIVVVVEIDTDKQLEEEDSIIEMEIYTSAEEDENVPDLARESVASLKGVAFSVYAKLEKNGHPIHSPDLEVIAHFCHYRDGRATGGIDPPIACNEMLVRLNDNGPLVGHPDLTANDGIFSGNFIPKSEYREEYVDFRGTYQIFVTAKLKQGSTTRGKAYPLPIDQENIRCGSEYQGCWNELVTEPFFAHAELKRRIDFIGKEAYTENEMGAATRILDLRISQSANSGCDIEWTEPTVLTETATGRANEYELYFANNFEDLLKENFRDKVYGGPDPIDAGRTAKVTVDDLEPGEKRWYMMRSILYSQYSPKPVWSNVIFVNAVPDYFQTTTTTSTTTTPAPTSSTTRLPTQPVTTVTPTRSTTKPSTTTTRRIVQSTTRESTTVSTTTTRQTTVKFETTTQEIKRWYKSTEAIVTFSLFGVGMVALIGGVLTYLKLTNRSG